MSRWCIGNPRVLNDSGIVGRNNGKRSFGCEWGHRLWRSGLKLLNIRELFKEFFRELVALAQRQEMV